MLALSIRFESDYVPTNMFSVFTADLECSYCISLTGEALKKHEDDWEDSSKEYDVDRETAQSATHDQETHPIISVDLQKVMLLSHMPRTKEAYFMSRLVTFHLTAAPLGNISRDIPTVAVCWNEAQRGRKASDIASAYIQILLQHRDAEEITIWCSVSHKIKIGRAHV